jgi:hypothetical protein
MACGEAYIILRRVALGRFPPDLEYVDAVADAMRGSGCLAPPDQAVSIPVPGQDPLGEAWARLYQWRHRMLDAVARAHGVTEADAPERCQLTVWLDSGGREQRSSLRIDGRRVGAVVITWPGLDEAGGEVAARWVPEDELKGGT